MPGHTKTRPIREVGVSKQFQPRGYSDTSTEVTIPFLIDTTPAPDDVNLSEITFIGPESKLKTLKRIAQLLEFDDADETVSADEIKIEMSPGKYLHAYRNRESLNQKELAEKVGTTQQYISQMESDTQPISKTMAEKLANALNCDYKRFL